MKLIQVKQSELKEMRMLQWWKQKKICPILNQEISFEDSVFDHKHKTKKEEVGEDGKGLLRGVLHFQANVFEGKIARLYKRCGLNKFIDLPTALRNLADYLEYPPLEQKYIHPSEKPKPKKLGKREYNKIKKHYHDMFPKRKKIPKYPKNGRITKQFEELLLALETHLNKKEKK